MPFFSFSTWRNEDTFSKESLDSVTHQISRWEANAVIFALITTSPWFFSLLLPNAKETVFKQWSPCWRWWVPLHFFETDLSFPPASNPHPILPKAQRKPLCSTSHSAGNHPLLQPHQQLKMRWHVAHLNPACYSSELCNKHSSVHR